MTRLFTHGPVPPDLRPLTPEDPRRLGPYRIAGLLGAGGMGAVYAAADEVGRCVAVKVIHAHFATDPVFRARFAREADLMRRVGGLCTVAVRAADTGAESPWIATDYVPGPTLAARIRDRGPLDEGDLAAFAAGTAEALHAVHGAGVVHRDLKPGNVVLSPDGPRVLDFGIARAVDGTAVTRTGMLMGTPGWTAPELLGGADPGPASDMFAWGGMVAYAATGRPPFGRGDTAAVLERTRREPPDLDGVPGWLHGVVAAALAKDPSVRPSALEALHAVGHGRYGTDPTLVASEPTALVTRLVEGDWSPGRERAPEPGRGRTRRRSWSPWPTLAAAAAVVLAVPLVGAAGYRLGGESAAVGGEAGVGGADPSGGATGGEGAGSADPESPGPADGPDAPTASVPDPEPFTQVTAEDTAGLAAAVVGGDTFVSESLVVSLREAAAQDGGVRITGLRTPRFEEGPVGPVSSTRVDLTAGARGDEIEGVLSGPGADDLPPASVPAVFTASFPGAPVRGTVVFHQRYAFAPGDRYADLRLCYDTGAGFTAPAAGEECPT
ncbi:serine/threonine-protein kinase [Nocardiopsis sp. CC223A]|uniref:protein kinase domain-containing protein n=1 Tax=Nocardiopsis sp. CC223A TaxID=3044051 RepID=UPI00278BE19C|nr:serine/threonine-protein kinase [Nocardiopsis sp. CC223A]